MPLQVIKSKPEASVFLISAMADVQIAISRISNPLFMKDASPIDRSLIGTMVSELGTNIIKYAGRGLIRICMVKSGENIDIEIWAEDMGPGISDINMAMKDHFTTGNTLGLGLPGVRRMADDFKIQSNSELGTIVYARKRIRGSGMRTQFSSGISPAKDFLVSGNIWEVGSRNRPMLGQYKSGDSISIVEFDRYILLSVIDVSGHGDKAHILGDMITQYIQNSPSWDLESMMTDLHKLLIGTLGAAVGLLLIDIEAEAYRYLGVGNISVNRCLGDSWRGISRDGVLGHRLPSLYEQAGFIKNGDIFALWSDGISDHMGKQFVIDNAYQSAEKIAHDLVSELGKPHDDASCLIFKWIG